MKFLRLCGCGSMYENLNELHMLINGLDPRVTIKPLNRLILYLVLRRSRRSWKGNSVVCYLYLQTKTSLIEKITIEEFGAHVIEAGFGLR